MIKKRLLLSIISFTLSFFVFIVATFAWFAISQTVKNSAINMKVDTGIISSSEFYYYTLNNVYKYDENTSSILVYDSGNWVTPTYTNPDDSSYAFDGIMLSQYDPLIPINNTYNNIILEMHLTYKTVQDTSISVAALVDTSLATDAINNFGYSTSVPYYLSEVSNLQIMLNPNYSSVAEGTNLFFDLTNDFNSLDANQNLVYPKTNFYDINNNLVSTLSLDSIPLYAATSLGDLYIFINFTYYEDKIASILETENAGSTLGTLPYIRFFPDIQIRVEEEVSSS